MHEIKNKNRGTRGYYKCNSQRFVVCTCAKTIPIFCNHNLASWPVKAIAKLFRLFNKILGHIFEWRRLLVGCWCQTGSQYLRNCSCPLGFSCKNNSTIYREWFEKKKIYTPRESLQNNILLKSDCREAIITQITTDYNWGMKKSISGRTIHSSIFSNPGLCLHSRC